VTIRENTERPITIELGTNLIGGTTKQGILSAYQECFAKVKTPPFLRCGTAGQERGMGDINR